jgi:hypothetical protein
VDDYRLPTLALLVVLLTGGVASTDLHAAAIELSDSSPARGSVVRVTVRGTSCSPTLSWVNGPVPLARSADRWIGYLPVGLEMETGTHPLTVENNCSDNELPDAIPLDVERGDYPVQRLTVEDTGKVQLSSEDLRRHRRESRQIDAALNHVIDTRLWKPPFHPPVDRNQFAPNDSFGSRRIINGQPRSPHSGEDYEASTGDPVYAINRGRVVLTGNFFFSGRGVFVDHGQGLTSMYFHLSEISVAEGDSVRTGEIIGAAGASGRVTGPHLHLGLEWNGARVDPDPFFFKQEHLFREING